MIYTTRKQAKGLIDFVRGNEEVKKYLSKYSWTSGSSTEVHPVALWRDELILQIETKKNVFENLIAEVKQKFDFVKSGYFNETDNSCPAELVFIFKNDGSWFYGKDY